MERNVYMNDKNNLVHLGIRLCCALLDDMDSTRP
jgi:hypothetical protein